jgi:hypothetical protein
VIVVLAILLAVLVLPAAAHAKFTCEQPRTPARDVPLRGLPDHPVAERTYRIVATLRPDEGVNPVPNLGAQYCGDDATRDARAGAGGWFRRVPGSGGRYALELRFASPGPWALSFMDRHGRFHELGLRSVRPANGFWPAALGLISLEEAVWIFAPSSPRSTALFPARARTSGS